MLKQKLLVIGGDKRIGYAARYLRERGACVSVFANDSVAESEDITVYDSLSDAMKENTAVIFGIPFSRDGSTLNAPLTEKTIYIDEIIENVKPHHIIIGGMLGDFFTIASRRGASCRDYGIREDFCLYNAVPTAEAAAAILIDKLPVTIWGSKFLVMGYGRIGKILSKMLSDFGAEVTVSARKSSDFALIRINGMKPVYTGPVIDNGKTFDAVINTIPKSILTDISFESLRSDCTVLDLSQFPGFVDAEAAKKHGIEVINAFSLPGRTAPAASGKIISDVIENIFDEIKGV